MRISLPSTCAAAAAAILLSTAAPQLPCARAVEPPSAQEQATLRRGFQLAQAGLLPPADELLTESIATWRRLGLQDELASIIKRRAAVRSSQGQLVPALRDLSEALELFRTASNPSAPPSERAAEVQRTFVARARVLAALQRWREAEADLSEGIARLDELDAIESTNPFLFSERGAARARLGLWGAAADDAARAEADFKAIGDKIRRVIAAADSALYLYGDDQTAAAVSQMRFTFKAKGLPASNNPDDIGLLQELSRKDAELHLAYAAHLADAAADAGAAGSPTGTNEVQRVRQQAEDQWESGCVRLAAYVADGVQRQNDEARLRESEARQAEERGPGGAPLRAASVKDQPLGLFSPNSDFNARLNGLDPSSPYVTQRPQQSYVWYKLGEGDVEVRDEGTALARIDEGLSCIAFREPDWLERNRPEWPQNLREKVRKFAAAVPQQPVVLPPKARRGGRQREASCKVICGNLVWIKWFGLTLVVG